jgi:phage terminase large subunit
MQRLINPNLTHLVKNYREGKTGAVLEGSSRSGKTFSSIDFIIWLCTNVETDCTINIIRETYNSFKTTLYDDFHRRLPEYGLYSPFHLKEVPTFKIFGNKINFLGADNPEKFHGAGCDYFFMNEGIDIDKAVFDQLEQRCRKFWWIDYNPKFTEHWIYDNIEPRDDVKFCHTTLFNNPFVSATEKKKILSYEPNEHNIKQGTADRYMWDVYGLGTRAAPEGLVFKEITWIDELPETFEKRGYGLDFGFTQDPTALVEGQVEGNNLYLKLHTYQPIDDVNVLYAAIADIVKDDNIIADSSDSHGGVHMGGDLRKKGLNIFPCKKFSGSIQYGIDCMKRYKLHIVRNPHARKEAENYKYKEINGIKLNVPIDKHNHFWDAARYVTMSLLSRD